ncbi:MAG: T9SS type A sorting domain-containing protein [Bacteroidota bacterium]
MNKNILLLLILAASSFVFSQTIDPYDYFPSSVENRWEYSVQGGVLYTEQIFRDSVDTNGCKYLFVNAYYTGGASTYNEPPLYKIDISFNIFIFPTYHHLNYLWYKLDADSGDSWWVKRPDSTTPGEKAFLTKVYDGLVLGKITTIKRIEYYMMMPGDTNSTGFYLTTREIALGIGMIYEWKDAVQPDFLIGAIIDGDTLGTITSVESEMTNNLLTDIILHQNYPNSFNPKTVIKFQVPSSKFIKLEVYDILGRDVQTLVDAPMSAGEHEVIFNGSGLPSGVYIYTLKVNEFSQSRKMLLLK